MDQNDDNNMYWYTSVLDGVAMDVDGVADDGTNIEGETEEGGCLT